MLSMSLSQPGQPAPPVFGPVYLAALVRRANHLSAILGLPTLMQLIAGKAFVGHIDAVRWHPSTGQTWRGVLAGGEKGLGQGVVVATGRGKAKAGNHAGRRNRTEQVKAL